ncbi:MAG TPA: hypothetical protein VGH55_06200 [Chthoniobacterales bacterium]|jgi:hypothetical protein
MYVYIKSEPRLWTVGFYGPDGKWHPETDYSSPEEPAKRVHWLNGERIQELIQQQAAEQDIER